MRLSLGINFVLIVTETEPAVTPMFGDHGYLVDILPAEFEAAFYARPKAD